jgi:hypothetical protein
MPSDSFAFADGNFGAGDSASASGAKPDASTNSWRGDRWRFGPMTDQIDWSSAEVILAVLPGTRSFFQDRLFRH